MLRRSTGVGVKALRPLRGRAAPSPEPNTELGAAPTPAEEIEKQLWDGASWTVTIATDKQGSTLVRWAAVEAVQRISNQHRLGQLRDQVACRRGRNIGVVAAARELLTLVFYGLRDGHIRCLHRTSA